MFKFNLFERNNKEYSPSDGGVGSFTDEPVIPDDFTNPGSGSPETNKQRNLRVLNDEPYVSVNIELNNDTVTALITQLLTINNLYPVLTAHLYTPLLQGFVRENNTKTLLEKLNSVDQEINLKLVKQLMRKLEEADTEYVTLVREMLNSKFEEIKKQAK